MAVIFFPSTICCGEWMARYSTYRGGGALSVVQMLHFVIGCNGLVRKLHWLQVRVIGFGIGGRLKTYETYKMLQKTMKS